MEPSFQSIHRFTEHNILQFPKNELNRIEFLIQFKQSITPKSVYTFPERIILMDEQELAQAAKQGDLDAFNRLVMIYQDMAFNVAYRLMSDEDAAADAAQDAFISAFRSLRSFRGGSFRAWLMRIVTNKCYDELRRRKRRPSIPLEPLNTEDQEEIESPRWLADDSPTPAENIETLELDRAIQHCLQRLQDDFRSVVIMIDIEGMDYQEAAQIIKKPLGTIKSRLARARVRLQNCLQQFRELLPSQYRLESEESA
jgi:RNA polymerase sigma-70 factor, ECF subfamily